ncbi:hypothetical protein DFH06DRAFT_1150313 [Mycena polygramma]|nr:hypothetical protein DFH06DRAFT_1150313 [Mycena polygramma]
MQTVPNSVLTLFNTFLGHFPGLLQRLKEATPYSQKIFDACFNVVPVGIVAPLRERLEYLLLHRIFVPKSGQNCLATSRLVVWWPPTEWEDRAGNSPDSRELIVCKDDTYTRIYEHPALGCNLPTYFWPNGQTLGGLYIAIGPTSKLKGTRLEPWAFKLHLDPDASHAALPLESKYLKPSNHSSAFESFNRLSPRTGHGGHRYRHSSPFSGLRRLCPVLLSYKNTRGCPVNFGRPPYQIHTAAQGRGCGARAAGGTVDAAGGPVYTGRFWPIADVPSGPAATADVVNEPTLLHAYTLDRRSSEPDSSFDLSLSLDISLISDTSTSADESCDSSFSFRRPPALALLPAYTLERRADFEPDLFDSSLSSSLSQLDISRISGTLASSADE